MAQAARFFVNGLHTTTKGIDEVAITSCAPPGGHV
jgi:hypothetical protein